MHDIEPYYTWRDYYVAEEDEWSPFFGNTYSEFDFSNKIYNFYIHPQWDSIESETLYVKVLYANYDKHIAIVELIGEWNDAINNDIETLQLNLLNHFFDKGIFKLVLIGENVLNYHAGDRDYYELMQETLQENDGWIVALHFEPHVITEMKKNKLHHYLFFSENLDADNWRKYKPHHILRWIENEIFQDRIDA